MFQNARTHNVALTAEIKYKDGTHTHWSAPRMEELSLTQKYLKERYRKWSIDNVANTRDPYFYFTTSRYLANLYTDLEHGPPDYIYLTVCTTPIPAPDVAPSSVDNKWYCNVKLRYHPTDLTSRNRGT
jgi:hypothetical protein